MVYFGFFCVLFPTWKAGICMCFVRPNGFNFTLDPDDVEMQKNHVQEVRMAIRVDILNFGYLLALVGNLCYHLPSGCWSLSRKLPGLLWS